MSGIWGPIIMQIIQMVIAALMKRIGGGGSQAVAFSTEQVSALAQRISAAAPQLDVSCIEKALPDLLRKVADALQASGGFVGVNIGALLSAVFSFIQEVITCQFAGKIQTQSDAAALQDKLLSCGVQAFVVWATTKDMDKAINGFLSCILGGVIGGGGSGSTPAGFNPKPVQVCG